MYNPEEVVEIWKLDIEAAERRATKNARFRHLRSKERKMLDAALTTVRCFFQNASNSIQGKPTTCPTTKELSC